MIVVAGQGGADAAHADLAFATLRGGTLRARRKAAFGNATAIALGRRSLNAGCRCGSDR